MRGRHSRRSLIIGAILLCAVWAIGFGLVLVHLNRLSESAPVAANQRGTAIAPAKPAHGKADAGSTGESGRTAQLDPRAAVLSIDELPGYKLINSAEAARPGGGTEPNSWDNLFQKSQAGARDYRMAEAILVVYGTAANAMAGVDQLRQAEESQGAKASPSLGASQSTTWVEPLAIPGYTLVRVVFRMDSVVAQVALLGKDDPVLTDEVQDLAGAQRARLRSLLYESS
jgi:hypothetical protein